MLTRQKFLNVCALLLGTSLTAFANVGYAAKPSPVPASNKPKLKVRVPTDAMRTHGQKAKIVQRPRIIVSSAPDPKVNGSPAVAAKTGALPGSAVVTRNVLGSAINTSKVATVVDGRNLNDVSAVKMIDLQAKAAQLGLTHLDSRVRGANSATFQALEQLMPGFQDKAKGASSLRDMGTSGHNRNPVTDGHGLDNFIGDSASTMGKGRVTHNADGSTTIKNKDGSTTDVWKDGTFYTENKDGTVEVDHPNGTTDYYGKDGRKTGSTGVSRQIIDPNNPGYYTDGTKVKDSKGSGSAKGNKGGQQGEPIQDDDTSSGPHHITAADLRGLAARRAAAGTPTGEETSSGGGQVNESKTRQGRIGQVGQPTPDSTTAVGLPDSMQIRQALRIRLRNINPVSDR